MQYKHLHLILILILAVYPVASLASVDRHPRLQSPSVSRCELALESARQILRREKARLEETAQADVSEQGDLLVQVLDGARRQPSFGETLSEWEESLRNEYAGHPTLDAQVRDEAAALVIKRPQELEALFESVATFHRSHVSGFVHVGHQRAASGHVFCLESADPTPDRLAFFRVSRPRGSMDTHVVCIDRDRIEENCSSDRCSRSDRRRVVRDGLEHPILYQWMARGRFLNSDLLNKSARKLAEQELLRQMNQGVSEIPNRCRTEVLSTLEIKDE
jgi:hypothetical protein